MENERTRNRVVGMYKEFVSEVDPRNVLDLLIQTRVISPERKDEVMNRKTRQDRCRALLDHLFSCSHERSFVILREALEEHYPWIVERIDACDADDENKSNSNKYGLLDIRMRYEQLQSQEETNGCLSSQKSSCKSALKKQFKKELDSTKTNQSSSRGDETAFETHLRKMKIFEQELEQTRKDTAELREQFRILKESQTPEQRCKPKKEFGENENQATPSVLMKANQMPLIQKDSSHDSVEHMDGNESSHGYGFLLTKECESCVIVIGGHDGSSTSNDVLKINLNQSEDVSKLQQLPGRMNPEIAAAVFYNSIFVTGLGSNCDEIWRLNAVSSTWHYCASMVRGRGGHSVAFVDYVLFICGGYVNSNKSTLDDVEAYDAIDNNCATVGKLVYAVRRSGNCVPFKASLYIFGGRGANYELLSDVQMYDTILHTSSLLWKPMPAADYLLRAALWGNSVILLGCSACFIYEFDTGIWKVRDKFKTDVVQFGLTVDNGKLFVIGGGKWTTDEGKKIKWTYRDDVRCIPVTNIMNDKPIEWSHHAKLPKPLFVFAVGKLIYFCQTPDDESCWKLC